MGWLERDPAGYMDGASLYAYGGMSPTMGGDASGLDAYGEGTPKFGELDGREYRIENEFPDRNDPTNRGTRVQLHLETNPGSGSKEKWFYDPGQNDWYQEDIHGNRTDRKLPGGVRKAMMRNVRWGQHLKNQKAIMASKGVPGFGGLQGLGGVGAMFASQIANAPLSVGDALFSERGQLLYRRLVQSVQARNRGAVARALDEIRDEILVRGSWQGATAWELAGEELLRRIPMLPPGSAGGFGGAGGTSFGASLLRFIRETSANAAASNSCGR